MSETHLPASSGLLSKAEVLFTNNCKFSPDGKEVILNLFFSIDYGVEKTLRKSLGKTIFKAHVLKYGILSISPSWKVTETISHDT